MVRRFLVTTSLEETWPRNSLPVLFLGEWCRIYRRKSAWQKLDAKVVPYHWDDRQKLYKDYKYIKKVTNEVLEALVAELNKIHNVNHSKRYWQIVIGPWVGYFIQILYDRWSMLYFATRDNEISGVNVLKRSIEDHVPNDMNDFVSRLIEPPWNEAIYAEILRWMKFPVEWVSHGHQSLAPDSKVSLGTPLNKVKIYTKAIVNRLFKLFTREDEFFFISSYLGPLNEFLLQLKLRQVPKKWPSATTPIFQVNLSMRKFELRIENNLDDFVELVKALIPSHIPTAYLEGYQKLVALSSKLPWPKRPAAIFTANSYSSDEVFKVWSADKVERGVPLIIGQHGGNYGVSLWNFTEDHQIEISDYFLTWGWDDVNQENIIPIGNFKGFGKKVIPRKSGFALLVQMSIPLNSYHMSSSPVSSIQWSMYFDDQCQFIRSLPLNLRQRTLIRPYFTDFNNCQVQRWSELFPELHVDDGSHSIQGLMKNSRIVISTYNATTYLESMSLNFPTIIFWNKSHWELRSEAIPFFEELKSVGIFHESPEEAAKKMISVWEDVAGWWNSYEVQVVRRKFCDRYAFIPNAPLVRMKEIFIKFAK